MKKIVSLIRSCLMLLSFAFSAGAVSVTNENELKTLLTDIASEFQAVLAFFCKLEFSMIKYSVLWAGTAIFWLSCLSCNIARIFRHVKGGLVRDRKIYPWTWRKICAK